MRTSWASDGHWQTKFTMAKLSLAESSIFISSPQRETVLDFQFGSFGLGHLATEQPLSEQLKHPTCEIGDDGDRCGPELLNLVVFLR